jgi:uncharacterized protein (TIGR03437 family)
MGNFCSAYLGLSIILLGAALSDAQTLAVSPSTLIVRMAATGPIAAPQYISISAGGSGTPVNWTATASADAPWISLNATAGATPATVQVRLVDWRAESQAPGSYSGTVTFNATGLPPATVKVTWVVAPRLPGPTFSYLSGPKGCSNADGYPDPALCTVPDEKPPGNFTAPGVGASYVDPNFGATVKAMTGPGVYHTYSANDPLSAGNKYLMSYTADGNFNVIDVATSKVAFTRVPANQNFFWDSNNDSVYYYPIAAAFMRHDLSSGQDSTVVDYAKDVHKFTRITRGGTGGSSKDNWISFFAPDQRQLCTLDLNTVKTYCTDYGAEYGDIDYTLDSKGVDATTGKRYVVLVAKGATPGVFSVNPERGKLDLEFRGPEDPQSNGNHDGICDSGERCMNPSHADTLEDSSGLQYLVFNGFTETPCEVATATYQLNKGMNILQPVELGGGKRRVMSLWRCPFPSSNGGTDDHVGCAKKAPYCVISSVAPYRSVSDPPLRFPHATEIIVMRENGLEVRRLAQSRSVRFKEEGDEAYWAEPRAAISNDGSLVVADSNFGERSGVRVTLIGTGFPKARPAVLNGASFSPSIAPGAYVTLQGVGVANCTASPDGPVLPITLCGASVKFNGVPARLSYVGPRQINVLAPRSLPVGIDIALTIAMEGGDGADATVSKENFGEVAPAIFSYSLDDGVTRALVQDAAGVLNGPKGNVTAAARLGETEILWANGLGRTDPSVDDGAPAPADSPAKTTRTVEVFVNGVGQTVQFAGLAPGFDGLYQVNFVLGPGTPLMPEGQNFIWVRVAGVESPQLAFSMTGN